MSIRNNDFKLMQEEYSKINEGLWDRTKAAASGYGSRLGGFGSRIASTITGKPAPTHEEDIINQKQAQANSLLKSYTPKFLKLKQELDMDLSKLGIKEVDTNLINQLMTNIKREVGLSGKGTGIPRDPSTKKDEQPVQNITNPQSTTS
jgi:hypothetical protein